MEGTAHYLCDWTDKWLREKTRGRAWVISVEARENDKNSSIYTNPNAGFKGWTPIGDQKELKKPTMCLILILKLL